jgi:16S rRNA G1207 methylase RsmC
LGCGNGILGKSISGVYPQAKGVFLDLSESMLEATKEIETDQFTLILEDFSHPRWFNSVSQYAPFEVIVSGFAIHHQTDSRKKELYQEIRVEVDVTIIPLSSETVREAFTTLRADYVNIRLL